MVSNWATKNGEVVLKPDFQQGIPSSPSPLPVGGKNMKAEINMESLLSSPIQESSRNLESLDGTQKEICEGADRLAISNPSRIEDSSETENGDDYGTHSTVVAERAPGFPWLAMSALCLGMLAHSVVFTNPLPFVAFMVVDFKMASNVDSAGYYAGWITGTFMIGKMLFKW